MKIDWTKPIQVFADTWRYADFVAEDDMNVCVRIDGRLSVWSKVEGDFRNTPPAPAACEHESVDIVPARGFVCRKCGQTVPTAAPSPSPAPDSVEAAIKLRDRAAAEEFVEDSPTKRDDLRAFMDFLTAYIAEQTAKAAGEYAKSIQDAINNVQISNPFQRRAIQMELADALCRAGKDGGK